MGSTTTTTCSKLELDPELDLPSGVFGLRNWSEATMNWDRVEGSWREFKGKAKSQWGALTDDELTRIGGQRDQLVGKLQDRYGYSKDRARQEIERWLDRVDQGSGRPNPGTIKGAMEVVGNLNSALQKSLKDNPRETLAVAAIAGFLLGVLWRM